MKTAIKNETIEIEPEILQFGKNTTQILKITNKTALDLQQLFFCLYNTQKFLFEPENFSLGPWENKLINVTLNLANGKAMAKDYAYLKSSQVSKRILLLTNNLLSPSRALTTEEGIQDTNTLSSREYGVLQQFGLAKLLDQKEAYILQLEGQLYARRLKLQTSQKNQITCPQGELERLKKDNKTLKIALLQEERARESQRIKRQEIQKYKIQQDTEREKLADICKELKVCLANKEQQIVAQEKTIFLQQKKNKEQLRILEAKLSSQGQWCKQSHTVEQNKSNYLEIAFANCQSDNSRLQQLNQQLQQELDQCLRKIKYNNEYTQKLELNLQASTQQVVYLKEIKQHLQSKNQECQQQHHEAVVRLKSQNIELLKRIAVEEQAQNRKAKVVEIQQENQYLRSQVNKLKNDTKKELKLINESAVSELRKLRQENIHLRTKAQCLQAQRTRSDSKTTYKSKPQQEDSQEQINRTKINSQLNFRKVGIKNQRLQLKESVMQSTGRQTQLEDLRELESYILNEIVRFKALHKLPQYNFAPNIKTVYIVAKLLRDIQNKMQFLEAQNSLFQRNSRPSKFQKEPGVEIETLEINQQSQKNINQKKEGNLSFVREQMKKQFKNMYDSLKLSEERFQNFKKKVHQQWRSKIMEFFNKEDRKSVSKLELTLQKFIDSLGNVSHKEAAFSRQAKFKNQALREASALRERNHQLIKLLKSKNSACTREPLKIIYQEAENDWVSSLRLEAQFLTQEAEKHKIKQEFRIMQHQNDEHLELVAQLKEQLERSVIIIDKLKQENAQIRNQYQLEQERQNKIIQQYGQKVLRKVEGSNKKNNFKKHKEYQSLTQQLQRKNLIIEGLRQKEQILNQQLSNFHSADRNSDKQPVIKRQQQAIKEISKSNQLLRETNEELRLEIQSTKRQLNLKQSKLNTFIGHQREQGKQIAASREERRVLADELTKIREAYDKYKVKKETEISNLKNSMGAQQNRLCIMQKRLESVARSLLENMRKIYWQLRLQAKKRGIQIEDESILFDIPGSLAEIDCLQIFQACERSMRILESSFQSSAQKV